MNNYKILENRPELTASQIVQGMNFGVVKARALSSQTTLGGGTISNAMISKGFIAAAIVAVSAILYKSYTAGGGDTPSHNSYYYIADTLPEPERYTEYHVMVNDSNIVLSAIESLTKSPVTPIAPRAACAPRPPANVPLIIPANDSLHKPKVPPEIVITEPKDKTYYTSETFNASPNATCTLWQPTTFGAPITSAATQIRMDCNGCDFYYSPSSKLDNKNLKGVWLHVTVKKKTKFQLESYFKNIALVQTTDEKCIATYPVAIGIGGPIWNGKEWLYWDDRFKTGGCTIHFEGQIDIYLVFDEVRPGDKLVMEDFIFAKVVE